MGHPMEKKVLKEKHKTRKVSDVLVENRYDLFWTNITPKLGLPMEKSYGLFSKYNKTYDSPGHANNPSHVDSFCIFLVGACAYWSQIVM